MTASHDPGCTCTSRGRRCCAAAGGFFASGFKRAFKMKDFGQTIPGHGGVTDRFDCQMIMAMFAYVYYWNYVASTELTVGDALDVSGLCRAWGAGAAGPVGLEHQGRFTCAASCWCVRVQARSSRRAASVSGADCWNRCCPAALPVAAAGCAGRPEAGPAAAAGGVGAAGQRAAG